ncbi:hypothetical protein DBR06_SOUSAS14910003, partial [Sousa chinensis]
ARRARPWAGPRGAGRGAWRAGARVGGPKPRGEVFQRHRRSPAQRKARRGEYPRGPAPSSVLGTRRSLLPFLWTPSETQAPLPAAHFSSFPLDEVTCTSSLGLRAARVEMTKPVFFVNGHVYSARFYRQRNLKCLTQLLNF